jgi:hypothetical protein
MFVVNIVLFLPAGLQGGVLVGEADGWDWVGFLIINMLTFNHPTNPMNAIKNMNNIFIYILYFLLHIDDLVTPIYVHTLILILILIPVSIFNLFIMHLLSDGLFYIIFHIY